MQKTALLLSLLLTMSLQGRVHHAKALKKARQYYVETVSNMPQEDSVHQITQ